MTDEIVIGGDSTDIPNGTYPGTLTSWNVKHSDKFDNDFRVWTFTLEAGNVVEGASSMATSSKSKGGRWIAALLGTKPEKGASVQVIGKKALLVVSSDRTEWPEVTDVLPPLAGGSTTPVERTETAATQEVGDLDF